jgi:hypothetical protein
MDPHDLIRTNSSVFSDAVFEKNLSYLSDLLVEILGKVFFCLATHFQPCLKTVWLITYFTVLFQNLEYNVILSKVTGH